MGFADFFSRQARKPSGLFGRFFMSRVFDKGNAEMNSLMFDLVSAQEGGHVLEIGFGTGALLHKIAGTLQEGLVEGVDFSETMVALAERKNRSHIKNGRVRLHLGDFEQAGLKEGSFDRIVSVNTVYFWQRPEAAIGKICRLLKPGGKLLLGFHEKKDMEDTPHSRDVFSYYSTQQLAGMLSAGGQLENVEIVSRKGTRWPCHCAIGTKPGA